MGEHSELDTEISVVVDSSDLDTLISAFGSDEVFAPAVEMAKEYKQAIEDGAKDGAYNLSKLNKSLQELTLARNSNLFTGALINSIGIEFVSETNYVVGTTITHFYPLCVEYGRGEVRPVEAKVLRWVTHSGMIVYSKYSSPSKPYPFVEPSYEETRNQAEEIVWMAIANATK